MRYLDDMKRMFAPLLISLLSLASAFSQTFPFRTYSIEGGLSESVVHDLIQDRDGYIWLATGFGLNKFDGIEFQHFFEDQGLLSSQTGTVYEARDGRIWVGTIQGAQFVVGDSVYSDPNLKSLEDQSVINIFEDSQGGFWFGTASNGVWHYYGNGEIDVYTMNNGLSGNQVRDITETADGTIWFATRSGLSKLKDGNFESYYMEDGLPENRIRDLEPDPQDPNILWIATRDGLSRFDGQSFTNYTADSGILDARIRDLTWLENGDLWLATEGGVSRLRDGNFINFTTEQGLSAEIIYSAITDREGNIWFGTFGGGASLFLGSYFENFDTDSGLPNNLVTSIVEDASGKLWIGSYGGGLVSYQDGEFDYFYSAQGLPDNRVYHLSTDSKGRTWIGMRDGLSYFQDGELYNLSESEFPYRKVRGVMEADNGDIWVSTYDEGLIRMMEDGYEQFTIAEGLPNNTVIATVQTDDGAIWAATYGGVVKWDGEEFEIFSLAEGVPNNGVMDIILDQTGTIWVSTFNGVAWYDGVKFVDITDEDGLPGRVCYFIEQDNEGIFWIGTNAGMARLDVQKFYSSVENDKDQAIQILQREQGLIADEANLGAVYEDSNGDLWFGTVDGVSKFTPSEYRGNLVPPRVKLTAFSAGGRDYEFGSIDLKHDRDFIQIDFAAVNFIAPDLVDYRYRLPGIDPNWQFTSERSAKYPSLPPGDYTFEVQARNSSGVWSYNIEEVKFSINPPYWFTWWFISLIVIGISGVIYLFYRNYQYMKMVDIERMRVRIASDLHDDVGASLTEVALQSDFLQASSLDSEFKNSLTQIGEQCRKIVTSLDDIVWSIDARNDTLGDLTDRMQDYILNVLEPLNFQVLYNFEELRMENRIPVPVKENLYLIFKEAINNIAKYSNGNKVDVTMNSNNGAFEFMIHDNGTSGKGAKKTGQGLRNMQMRAHRMGGNVNISDEDGFKIILTGKLTMN